MFITFSDKLIDINSIESAGLILDVYPDKPATIDLIGKSGTVYREKFYISNDPKEKEILDKRWFDIEHALFLSGLPYNYHEENFPQEDDIPF